MNKIDNNFVLQIVNSNKDIILFNEYMTLLFNLKIKELELIKTILKELEKNNLILFVRYLQFNDIINDIIKNKR